ncbi:carboxypeptidase-like regulatory domain-containing protein [Hymenobacter lapidiphilus]|uniref:Carboxypeptidase regulatory-like domain-containing protein n=1 Tax=Hymenobacter lapidiphilus TaxID=2608003 RepID=A0A7Y7PQQ2_9BACT|nr:carboxypeptidase-like regulatory domain-containing protein [Hymenobacter lapidiphilus]NVO32150.1 carboxypeptidase regulatory-like domain-containing protein [Hymenobacter lapidiphilus]
MLVSPLLWSLLSWSIFAWPGAPLPATPGVQGPATREVYGNVTDLKNIPVAGASVSVGTDSRTLVVTNSEGRFLLKGSALEFRLLITSAGYYDTSVVVPAASTAFNARLRPIANYKRQFKRQYKSAKRAYKN